MGRGERMGRWREGWVGGGSVGSRWREVRRRMGRRRKDEEVE